MAHKDRSKQIAEITLSYKRTEDNDLDNLLVETFHQLFSEIEAEFRTSMLKNTNKFTNYAK